jgi:single-strand DNA-binding protein
MYTLVNKVQLIGHLGGDPDVKTTSTGKKWARIKLATNEDYRDENGVKVNKTQWHSLIAWGKVADVAEKFLQKGSEIAIEGKLINSSYTDKQGVKKYSTEVQVNEIMMFGEKHKKS